MSLTVKTRSDYLDLTTNYFTNAKPREFFRTIHQLFFWNKYLTGKETSQVHAALRAFPNVFDAFNILDLIDNLNNLRNRLAGKNTQDLSTLVSDTVGSACDTASWLSVSAGIVSLSANALNWAMIGSGASMIFSFTKYTFDSIKDLVNQNLNKDQKKIKMIGIAKNISLLAIGLLVFIPGWFGTPLMVSLLSMLGSIVIISKFAIYMIENSKKIYLN